MPLFIIYPEYYTLKHRIIFKLYFRRLKKADAIIAVSKSTKNDLVKYLHIPENMIHIVYNGVEDAESISANKSFKTMGKYFFYIGDFRKNKNVINALKGFKRFIKYDNDIKFILAGQKKYEYDFLKEFVKDHNLQERVKFLGYVTEEEKNKLYNNAYALIFVSEYEGFGVPIIEAMSNGVPVITSNSSSMKEIAYDAGILVDCHDPDDICKGMLSLKDNKKYEEFVKKGKERVKRFTWDNATIQFERVLEIMIKGS